MTRTTVDIDGPILEDLKRLQKRDGKSLGRLVSDLLAAAMGRRTREAQRPFRWVSQPMAARIDLADKEAVHRALDGHDERPPSSRRR
jgi:hypothetical protein